MSLSSSKLAKALEDISTSFPESYDEAGQRWAAAYISYGNDGQTPFAAPASLSGAQSLLAKTLAAAFAAGVDSSSAIAAAVTAAWLSPPVSFAGARAGVVTLVGGTAALASALRATFAANVSGGVTSSDACRAIAADLHTFTMTVQVLHPAPPPPVLAPVA